MLSLIIFTFALAAPAIFAASGNEEVYRMPEEEVLKLGELLEDSFDSSQNTNFDNTNNPLKTNLWPSFGGKDLLFPIKQCKINGKTYRNMFQCPSRQQGVAESRCVKYADLCDGHPECPNMEDEHPLFCLFHKLHESEMSSLRRLLHEQQHPASHHSSHASHHDSHLRSARSSKHHKRSATRHMVL